MSIPVPPGSLWPPFITGVIQTPFRILSAQAVALTQQTNGILEGCVARVRRETHRLDPVTGFRAADEIGAWTIEVLHKGNKICNILEVTEAADGPYPAQVWIGPGEPRLASNDVEFIYILSGVLRSSAVVAKLCSAIARICEENNE